MKIYSSKQSALNSLPSGIYEVGLYCTGKYKTSIKEMESISSDIKAFYKSYRKDDYGSYVKVYCVTESQV